MVDTRSALPSAARPARVPVTITAALLAVAVALAVVLFTVIRPDRHHNQGHGPGGLTATEQAAVTAGAQQLRNSLTYKRTTFAADYARTEAGATGAVLTDLQKDANKTQLLQAMTTNKFDLDGVITASAFEQSNGSTYLVLVSAQGYTVADNGTRTLKTSDRFEVTLEHSGTRWLASNVVSVGLI